MSDDLLMQRATGREVDGAGREVLFIGRGLSWPMGVDHTGAIRLTSGTADLDRSIRMVLVTAPGERVMRPQFGCRIWEMLFEPVTPNLLGLMAEAVREAVAQWEPRVTVSEVVVEPDGDDPGLVHIRIDYEVRATNDRRNLVYPFYVIPRGED
ncbi:MAG: GPW/gp25 family protein [Mycobacteriales bacterium]